MHIQRSLFLNFYKAIVALVAAFALLACTPTYDWRTVKSDDLLFEALYPGKPTRAEKTLLIADQKIKMTMEAARAGDALYAVGAIQLSQEQSKLAHEVSAYLQKGILANLGHQDEPELSHKTVRTLGSPSYELPAKEWQLSGLGPDQKKRVMIVRQIQRQFPDGTTMIYQLSVLQSNLNDKNAAEHTEQHQMFLNQFRPF
jgi:hypothetical protein